MDSKRLSGAEVHLKITRLPDATDQAFLRAQPSMQQDVE